MLYGFKQKRKATISQQIASSLTPVTGCSYSCHGSGCPIHSSSYRSSHGWWRHSFTSHCHRTETCCSRWWTSPMTSPHCLLETSIILKFLQKTHEVYRLIWDSTEHARFLNSILNNVLYLSIQCCVVVIETWINIVFIFTSEVYVLHHLHAVESQLAP